MHKYSVFSVCSAGVSFLNIKLVTMCIFFFIHFIFQLSTDVNMQTTETSKFVDLSVVDLGIATSSFFDLDNTTSWVMRLYALILLCY